MGFWKTLGRIGLAAGSVAAVPLTGGASATGVAASLGKWIPKAIAVGTGVANALGAKHASGIANKAGQTLNQAAIDSNKLLDPYSNLGSQSATQLSALMDPNSEFSKGFQGKPNLPAFEAPNPADVLNNPAIQFQLDQGQKAIERSAASKGGINSGATLKRVNQFAQGTAAQGYNDVFSHAQQSWQDNYTKALQDFNSAFGIYQDTRNSRLDLLNRGLNSGQDAANRQGANLQGGADALAAGRVAGSNSWTNAINSTGKNVMDLYSLSKLKTNQTAAAGGGPVDPGPDYGPWQPNYSAPDNLGDFNSQLTGAA